VEAALSYHEGLFNVIQSLKSNPNIFRRRLSDDLFRELLWLMEVGAINLAVKVITMINCSANHQTPSLLEHGAFPNSLEGQRSFQSISIRHIPIDTPSYPQCLALGSPDPYDPDARALHRLAQVNPCRRGCLSLFIYLDLVMIWLDDVEI
jgi:hypothetical protein